MTNTGWNREEFVLFSAHLYLTCGHGVHGRGKQESETPIFSGNFDKQLALFSEMNDYQLLMSF
ncbi:MAG: hypothetical protein IPP37_14205 [Saprospiraceae bacterium]|nr:hypothetical protein [Saprospiraceae bacterium]